LFSFRLSDTFVSGYASKKVDWGFTDAGGTSLGEITFLRTYSRIKPDGTKERWHDVCERVINGMYSIQKDHAKRNRLPWSDVKAQRSAEEAFDRMFHFKWLPPGRGIWMMGTPLVMEHRNSAALQNCAFVSTADMTRHDPSEPFTFLMEASMLGVGVGFDTKGADKGFKLYQPGRKAETYTVPDTREGWVESVKLLLNSYLKPEQTSWKFDYSEIRPSGEPIKTFGGTAAGPDPLERLHNKLFDILDGREGQTLNSIDILDIGNLIGVCVVSGNVRRSAELALGSIDDTDFLNAKNSDVFPDRMRFDPDGVDNGWGWMSNNSVAVNVGDDLSKVVEGIARNGEPGVIWMDLSRSHGRLIDPPDNKDHRAAGYNPCAEQTLESYEMCTLVETFLNRHENLGDFARTLKFAYLYAKTVTLLPTHWEKTNAIMIRNRRIGTSMSGIANFVDNNSIAELREWSDEGFHTVQMYDKIYSEWLGVRESIKTTTVKPSGTVSILAGESPGVHWSPGGEFFERRIRFGKDDPMVTLFRQCGYLVEDCHQNPDTTVVVAFPIHSNAKRSEKDVTLFEKAHLAAEMQRYWSNNSVSVTLSFDPEKESQHVAAVLGMYAGQLKTASFLPMSNGAYRQMPYTDITADKYLEGTMTLFPVDLTPVYEGNAVDAVGEAFCSTDSCEVKQVIENQK
jgi:ribonucleoside-triphosphate reductase